jgi:HECT-domain (ubiquitin-transferase)
MSYFIAPLGIVHWSICFRLLPTETVSHLAFGRQEITEEMLFTDEGRFRFIKFSRCEDNHPISDAESDAQKLFEVEMEQLFKEKLEVDPTFIINFLSLCTGSEFIPDPEAHPEYAIMVEFNASETQDQYVPIIHTCVNLIKLPATAYDGDMKVFEEKLRIAMKLAGGTFDMT